MGTEISKTGKQRQRVKQGGDRDEQTSVGSGTEIEWSQVGRGVVEKGWNGTDFVEDPSVIQYLTHLIKALTFKNASSMELRSGEYRGKYSMQTEE